MRNGRQLDRKNDSAAAVEAAIRRVRAAWKTGLGLQDFPATRSAWDRKARWTGINANVLRAMRKAAKPKTGFSPADLRQIEASCRTYRRAFGPSLLFKFSHIADRRQRMNLVKKAIRERWSYKRICLELLKTHGRREKVGKRPTIPRDPVDLLGQIDAFCLKWVRWHACLTEDQTPDNRVRHAGVRDLPVKVRTIVRQATQLMGRLQTAVQRELERERIG